jgi:hypothetical protein
MRSTRLATRHLGRFLYCTLFLFLFTLLTPAIVAQPAADEGEEQDEYDVKARVVRISLLTGEVNLKRAGSADSERARLNLPLVEGDTLSTERDARVEIQIDGHNFVRVGENSILRIVTLRDEGVALSVVEGLVSVRLKKFDSDKGFFEIDAPKTTLTAEKSGLYRIDVRKDGHVRLTARDGARARIYSETSGFALRDGRSAELIIDGPDAGEWEVVQASQTDSWDTWINDREQQLAQRLRYDNKYYDNDVWGAEDLDAYGAWLQTDEYGWMWRPHTTVISSYQDWAPYRYGEWVWIAPYGWTWVGNEPWGWAPYHYGRWVYHNNYWAWVPQHKNKPRRSWWRPALVAFLSIDFSFGNQVCWYPLSYHDRDPRSRNYHRDGNRRSRDGRGEDRREHRWRGVTAVPAGDFGRRHPRLRPVEERWARRLTDTEPLREAPIRPARENNRTRGEETERRNVARSGEERRRDWAERRTGAANRSPGVPLDGELRRARVWNRREERPRFPVASGGAGPIEARPTGAVTRRPLRQPDPTSDADSGREIDRSRERGERSSRSNRTGTRENAPAAPDSNSGESSAPVHVPVTPHRTEDASPAETERPENNRREAGNDRERPSRRDSSDDSSSRSSRSERRSEPARLEPRNDVSPQSEPVRERSEPTRQEAPRNEAPQRSEPRNDPPQRSEPAPQRSEPAKSDPPSRSEPTRSEPLKHENDGESKTKDPR